MIIDIIDNETVEVYGETGELARKNASRFIKLVLGKERWKSHSGQGFNTCMDLHKRYVVKIKVGGFNEKNNA